MANDTSADAESILALLASADWDLGNSFRCPICHLRATISDDARLSCDVCGSEHDAIVKALQPAPEPSSKAGALLSAAGKQRAPWGAEAVNAENTRTEKGEQPQNGTGLPVPQPIHVDSWKARMYHAAVDACDKLIAGDKTYREYLGALDLEAYVNTLTDLRPQFPVPALLNATEIEEETRVVAAAVQKLYAPLSLNNGNGKQPIVIPWEGFDAALAANEAYLARTPVVDKLCYSSAVSMITGGKHAGKSTLARWMAICVVKGWPFLNRDVVQGAVCYIASDDETMPARQELIRLGWTRDDALRFLSVGASGVEDRIKFLELLSRDIKEQKAVLVILDMLFDFVDIADEMSYAGTREALGRIQAVASQTGAHVVTIHHAPKHAQTGDAAVTALGSQGLAARVSPILLVRRFGPGVHSVVSTNVRDPRGEAIVESRLVLNVDGSVTLGGVWKTYMLAEAYSPRVLEFLQDEEGAEKTAPDVAEGLSIAYEVARACLNSLWKGGSLHRAGSGKKGQPYRYSISATNDKWGGKNTPHVGDMQGNEEIQNYGQTGRFGYKD